MARIFHVRLNLDDMGASLDTLDGDAEYAGWLRGFRSGGSYLCRCPVPSHGRGRGDYRPSLRLSDGEEKLLVYCFSILLSLRRLGLWWRLMSSRPTDLKI